MHRLLICLLVTGAATAADDALSRLPLLPRLEITATAQPPFDPLAGTALAPGVRVVPGTRVVLDGMIQVDKGPVDGLEVLACLSEGKTHETLIRLKAADGAVVKAAVLAAFALPDGKPAAENSGIPARGTPMRLAVLWRDEDGAWRQADAATLIRDRTLDRAFPALPWVHTGSRILLISEPGPDGKNIRRERFMLDSTRSLAVNYDEPDALLASPFPYAEQDARFEANSSLVPPPKTPVHLVISPAETVLSLHLDPAGQLALDGKPLDDAALAAALRTAFAAPAKPAHHAVTVRTPAGISDDLVVATRARILAAAAAGAAWAVPVFQPE